LKTDFTIKYCVGTLFIQCN